MIVAKFGGTSVADAAAITRTAGIVRGRVSRAPVVVVSALAGTTNALLEAAGQASGVNLVGAITMVEQMRARHLAVVKEILGVGADTDELGATVSMLFDELAHLLEALSVLGHMTPRSLDAIASYGEQFSAPIVEASLRHAGVDAVLVDARKVMVTDAQYGRAEPRLADIGAAARENVRPLVLEGRVPVLGGYIGATPDGITTTLGRGGSDFTASLLGAALEAEAIEIWTDVDGMLTADPRVVRGARLIEHIRFDEASELASFGAKVLHPNTIAPAVARGIPVFVFNSMKPEGSGTRITADAPRHAVRAIAGKGNTAIIKVRSPRMLGASGALQQIFEVFARRGLPVDVVTTSEVSVSLTLDETHQLDEVLAELRAFGDAGVERGRGIIAVVGAALATDPGAMARAIAAIGHVRLHMLSLDSTGINLTMVMDGDQVRPVMQRLHDTFFGGSAA
ncbi:MAG: lysine-sensitive aspartokinase 3 [Gemmatimonadaceae bacterium]|nr:lysine-sensitive aspartokinase 3 [Gemmatimonadaceae bacterium]